MTAFKTVNIINEQFFQQKLSQIPFRNNKHQNEKKKIKMLEGHCSCKSSSMLAINPHMLVRILLSITLQIYSKLTYRVQISQIFYCFK